MAVTLRLHNTRVHEVNDVSLRAEPRGILLHGINDTKENSRRRRGEKMLLDRSEWRSTLTARWLVLRERILSRDASNGADETAKETGRKDYRSARCYSQEYWSRTEVRYGGPGDNKTDERAGVPLTTGPKTDRNSAPRLLIDPATVS